jgi:hypothetical protein
MIATDLSIALDPALLMERAGMVPDPWQAGLLRSTASRHLLLCNWQAGKSTSTAALAVWEALYSAPALILLLSPALRQSQELFIKVMSFYHAVADSGGVEEESALRVTLKNGSRIIALPGTEQTVRGYSGARLIVIDEASRVEDALYFSVRPMLAVSGGRLVLLSTPFGKRGAFFDAWESGEGFERVKVTAYDCPRISREFLEEERRALGDWWFEQEYLCLFKETTDQVFSYDLVMGMMSNEVQPLFDVSPLGGIP